MSKTLKIFTDGGARGNPGPAGIGIWAQLEGKTVFEHSEYVGEDTNNVAEYLGLIRSIELLLPHLENHNYDKVEWYLDSKLIIEQVQKNWKIKQDHLRKLAEQAWTLLEKLSIPYSLTHVPRAQNKEADTLVNKAVDAELG